VRGPGAGLLASAFVGMVPSYISRSVAGSYDNEGVAIFALVNVFFLFIKVSAADCVLHAGLRSVSVCLIIGLSQFAIGCGQSQFALGCGPVSVCCRVWPSLSLL